jgi:pilus assembly protein CpaE
MLRAICVCPDQEVTAQLQEAVADVGNILFVRMVNHYPNELNLVRMVRATGPGLVFLSIESMSRALEVAANLEEIAPGIQVVAISRSRDPQVLEQLIRSEIREFLVFPFCRTKLLEAIARTSELLAKKPPAIASTDLLFAFLPSKPGVGTSTIAMNASIALSKVPDTRVLLTDLDLNSGVIQFMLKLDHRYSVLDAAQRAPELDENIWPEVVHTIGNLDVLHAGECNPGVRIEAVQLHQLLDFARRHYSVLCADLSGNMEQYSLELMREARRIFLVCTPELSSVHLARKRYHYLRSQDLGDHVSLLLNRAESDSMVSAHEIEDIVGLPVWFALPNDYKGVLNSVFHGGPVNPDSRLGQQFTLMAHALLDAKGKPVQSPLGIADKVSNWLSSRPWKSLIVPVRR